MIQLSTQEFGEAATSTLDLEAITQLAEKAQDWEKADRSNTIAGR